MFCTCDTSIVYSVVTCAGLGFVLFTLAWPSIVECPQRLIANELESVTSWYNDYCCDSGIGVADQ